METLIILKEVAKILLLVGAFGLCVIVAIGLVKLFPHLRRWAEHMATTAEAASKIAGDFAVVSTDVAGDMRKTVASTAVGAEHLATTAVATAKIAGDFAAISADVAEDMRKAAASTAVGAEHLATTAGAASKISGDFAAVSADVAGDVQKTAALTAKTAKNLMESSAHLQGALQILGALKRVDLDKLAANLAAILKGGASQIPEVWRSFLRRVPRPNS